MNEQGKKEEDDERPQSEALALMMMQLREEILPVCMYVCAESCDCTVFLLVCTHVGDKHMWQSKQSCHWWDCSAQGACTSMPMLVQRALNNLLTLSNGTLAGPETCRQHEELSPDNNFDILAPPGSSWLSWLLLVILIILAPPGYPGHPE